MTFRATILGKDEPTVQLTCSDDLKEGQVIDYTLGKLTDD
jgi:hypothetical protein